jgi:putative endonuclease
MTGAAASGVEVACRAGMSQARQTFGRIGEDLACAELERRGYVILERRYRCRAGEVDIVARDGQTVVFVEVKARGSAAFGNAAEAVTVDKRRRLARLALHYLARHGHPELPCRFDVVSVGDGPEGAEVTVIPHAFAAFDELA